MAPIAGKVTEIKVAVKQVVETGKPMVIVEG